MLSTCVLKFTLFSAQIVTRWVCVATGWVCTATRWLYFVSRWVITLSFQSHSVFTFLTAVNNIHLILYGDLHICQALALVANEDQFTEVLQLEFEPRNEGDDAPPQLEVLDSNPLLEAAIIKAKGKHVEGDKLPNFANQAGYSTHASTSLCLDNQEQYLWISHYMNSRGEFDCIPVAPDESCISSLQRLISAPFEYRNIPLRRQLVVLLADHKKFFFKLLKEHIKGTYGFPRQDEDEYQERYREGILTDQEVHDHNCPGPFSYHSYLAALLEPNMWGDEQVLCLCSMMWQHGITVVSVDEVTHVRFWHKATLSKADVMLVMCSGQHYVPAHK